MQALTSLFSLENRTALVTGGTRGIGAQMAIALAEAGADIILVQVSSFMYSSDIAGSLTAEKQRDTSNQQTKQHIESLGRKATIYTADLGSRSAVSELSKSVLADGHDISILINCAGIQRRHPAHEFPDNDWDEVSLSISGAKKKLAIGFN
jgi:2-deoxy-D-gluconate 3-dehydrogenase